MTDCQYYTPTYQTLDCQGQLVRKEDWGCTKEDDLLDSDQVCGSECSLYEEGSYDDPRCDDHHDDEDD